MTTSLPSILPLVAFPNGLFSALYSSSCTLHLSVLLSLLFPFPSTTTFTQMILSSSLFTHSTLTQAFLTFKTLKNQHDKIHNSSLDTSIPLCSKLTLASSLTNMLLSLTKLQLSPKPVTINQSQSTVYYHIRQPRCIRPYLDSSTACTILPLLPLSFTPNLITVILSTINFLSRNYLVSSYCTTLFLVLSLKLH